MKNSVFCFDWERIIACALQISCSKLMHFLDYLTETRVKRHLKKWNRKEPKREVLLFSFVCNVKAFQAFLYDWVRLQIFKKVVVFWLEVFKNWKLWCKICTNYRRSEGLPNTCMTAARKLMCVSEVPSKWECLWPPPPWEWPWLCGTPLSSNPNTILNITAQVATAIIGSGSTAKSPLVSLKKQFWF